MTNDQRIILRATTIASVWETIETKAKDNIPVVLIYQLDQLHQSVETKYNAQPEPTI